MIGMDYRNPLEALIPGARGRVLAALATNLNPRTIRQVALSAQVSSSQAGLVVEDLAELGIVERHETPAAVLVRLVTDNVAAMAVKQLSGLWDSAVKEMREAAALIEPAPVSLTLFGSFAHAAARRDSDVDVFAVHDPEVERTTVTGDRWQDTIGTWVDTAGRITGNPVNLIDLALEEVRALPNKGWPDWLRSAALEGIVLTGQPVRELTKEGARRHAR
jgi:predicted nucleotidyltransferase